MMNKSGPLYPVLSSTKVKRPTEADRRLPTWLSQPTQFPAVNLIESGQDIDDFDEYIDDDLRAHIKKTMNMNKLFPVQKCLIPALTLQFKSRPYRRPNDICVSSPTGSGKTLAFAIPIVTYLRKSLTRSLRVLIMLPSRDLAQQVFKLIREVCQPTHLRSELAVGEAHEQHAMFFKRPSKHENPQDSTHWAKNKTTILQNQYLEANVRDEDYVSAIDILVSTPGALIDLMNNCPGFTLKDLEILVMDEADRLMTSHKHDWLNTLERSMFPQVCECPCSLNQEDVKTQVGSKKLRLCFSSTTGCSMRGYHLSRPLHKLLFSATLSSDPQILMHMNLYQPRLFIATRPTVVGTKIRYSLGSQTSTPSGSPVPNSTPSVVSSKNELLTSATIPDQLDEKMFITEAKEKLFIMWYIFHELKYRKVICFVNSRDTSFRLCKFLNEVHEVRAVESSSNLKPETRQKYLNEFRLGRIDVIVASDNLARGIDIDDAKYVISYDAPLNESTYVHRVGRTARAGKEGTAITLVEIKQLVQFKKVVQLAHRLPNSMRLGDVIEEIKLPQAIKKDQRINDMYTKTLEDFEDSIEQWKKKRKFDRM